jgi:hypothetical protein
MQVLMIGIGRNATKNAARTAIPSRNHNLKALRRLDGDVGDAVA